MSSFYAIMLNYAGAAAPVNAAVENILNTFAQDWLRFSSHQYLVKSDWSSQRIYEAIKPVLPPKAHGVVVSVNINDRFGFASTTVVDWIVKHAP